MTLSMSSPRAKGRWALLIAAVAMISLVAGTVTLAVHGDPPGLFELDGDPFDADAVTEDGIRVASADPDAVLPDDWDSLFPTAVSTEPIATTFIAEPPTTDTTYFKGGGSKDINDLPQWAYAATPQAPDKNEITNAYAAAYTDDAGDFYVYFGQDRFSNDGNSNVGFWFFKNQIRLEDGEFVGTHADGDVFIVSAYTNGGTIPGLTVYEWRDGGLQLLEEEGDCSTAPTDHIACAAGNTQTTEAPWSYVPKANVGSPGAFPPNTFFEGGINLTGLGAADTCFSSFLAETRSSQETTAQLKDFAFDTFDTCKARISIGDDATNEVGVAHDFTVLVEGTTGGAFDGVAGASVTATVVEGTDSITSMCGVTQDPAVDEATGTTDADGECVVTVNSNVAGSVTVHAAASFTLGGETKTVETDGVGENTGDAVKTYVDAQIDLSPLTATNEVNDAHTITATVQQDDGLPASAGDGVAGWAPAPDGTTVTFTLPTNTASAAFVGGIDSCTTTSGSCSVSINTSTAGSVDINATTTFSVGGESLTRTTGTGGNNSADANKVYVDGSLVWHKEDNLGNPLGGATFDVCRTHNLDTSTDPDTYVEILDAEDQPEPVCVSVTDNAAPDEDPADGEFLLDGLVLGRYTVQETAAPDGFAFDDTTVTAPDMTILDPDVEIETPFVNSRLFRLIVITCNESLNELVDSTVTLDSDPTETITEVPQALADKGVTEADLCGIGGASYGELEGDTYSPSVELPDVEPLFTPE